ncbi:putative F-box protein [Capsicum chacoense]
MSTLQSSNRIEPRLIIPSTKHDTSNNNPDTIIIAKLYTIREAIADRVEMHKNICEQRCQWNTMLLTSINCITLAAATITAIAITSTSPIFGLKLCSTLMYFAVTCMLVLLNQLQPSQLAEEQRNASRLFRNLLNQIDTTLSIGQPVSNSGVKMAMLSVLALDKAYPLPIIGTMLDKFPYIIEPAIWWPQQQRQTNSKIVLYDNRDDCDGWNGELEEEMRQTKSKIVNENRGDCNGWNGKLDKEMRRTKSKIVNENRDDCNGWNEKIEEEMRRTKSKIVNENRDDCNGKLEEEMRQRKSKIVNENRDDCNGRNEELEEEIRQTKSKIVDENRDDCNGWDRKLEEDMREVAKILEKKDQEEYIRLATKALNLNKFLAVLGPVLTGLATIGSALVGSSRSWAAMIGVVPGALACIVNTIQHGGQVGMVFEMYRSNAGFFKYMKESIESNLMEKDVNKRENGEVFEMKLALNLGRSLCELRELANSYSSCKIEELDEFASKLF